MKNRKNQSCGTRRCTSGQVAFVKTDKRSVNLLEKADKSAIFTSGKADKYYADKKIGFIPGLFL